MTRSVTQTPTNKAERYEEAYDFLAWHYAPEWEREQFARWYSNRRQYWKPVNPYQPFAHLEPAYQVWVRRP